MKKEEGKRKPARGAGATSGLFLPAHPIHGHVVVLRHYISHGRHVAIRPFVSAFSLFLSFPLLPLLSFAPSSPLIVLDLMPLGRGEIVKGIVLFNILIVEKSFCAAEKKGREVGRGGSERGLAHVRGRSFPFD